jgi:hypothetical protein
MILVAGLLHAGAADSAVKIFSPKDYPGKWTLVTNADATITATEAALHRQGNEAFQRVLSLTAVSGELKPRSEAATAGEIKDFISGYQPPAVPYTSEAASARTGREKFNCLEFAEDLVAKANAVEIPAEVIGIKFEGQMVGHACAGFPTMEGGMLYFDSTPAAGQISRRAYESWVEVGQTYRRADGGELAGGVENLPIEKIIPVSPLTIADSSDNPAISDDASDAGAATPRTTLIVEGEKRVQADGIEYAGPDTLRISEAQLAKWNQAAAKFMADRAVQQEAQKRALESARTKADARALKANEELAASGDAYGELRMGECYLTGDGVEKNIATARTYLQSAADQGSQDAADDLKLLIQPAK